MVINPIYKTKIFLKDKNGNLFDITWFTKECNIILKAGNIIMVNCVLYEVDKNGCFILDINKGEVLYSIEEFPLFSSKLNNKEGEIILDALRFILPSYFYLKPHIRFWDKIFRALAKGFL